MAHWGSHGVEEAPGGGGDAGGGGDVGGGGGAGVGEGVLRLAASSAAMSAGVGDGWGAGGGLFVIVWVGRPERERELLLRRWAAAG